MPLQNITTVTVDPGGTPTVITGCTSMSVTTNDDLQPVHIDGDSFNSIVCDNLGEATVTLNSTDHAQLLALDGAAAADVTFLVNGVGGTSNATFTLENAVPHSYTVNVPEPGGVATSSLTFTGVGDTAAASGLTVA